MRLGSPPLSRFERAEFLVAPSGSDCIALCCPAQSRPELAVTSPTSSRITPTEKVMNLEQTLEKIVEHAHEELRIVRKRAEEKTAARDHGKDYHEAQVRGRST